MTPLESVMYPSYCYSVPIQNSENSYWSWRSINYLFRNKNLWKLQPRINTVNWQSIWHWISYCFMPQFPFLKLGKESCPLLKIVLSLREFTWLRGLRAVLLSAAVNLDNTARRQTHYLVWTWNMNTQKHVPRTLLHRNKPAYGLICRIKAQNLTFCMENVNAFYLFS